MIASIPNFYKNYRPFSAIVDCQFGRKVIYTDVENITLDNILEELQKAKSIHAFNAEAIRYLDNYYRGDQPARYRRKDIRPEINNKIIENHALEIVDSKVADLYGEPIQYVLHGSDEAKAKLLLQLNSFMDTEDKSAIDIERGTWASICGTSYLYVGDKNRLSAVYDEAPYFLRCENPEHTFVVYYSDDKTPAFSCQERTDKDGDYDFVYTKQYSLKIRKNKIVEQKINGNFMIPVIEYPNNSRRLSDIEITIEMTDAINKMASDRQNGVEQFIQAFMLFKNCEIDDEGIVKLRDKGAISIKDCADGKQADLRILAEQLDQTQSQTLKEDMYNSMLIVQGMPDRKESSGGNTGLAVQLSNGYYAEDKRAELRIPIFKRSERMMLRVVLNKLRVAADGQYGLKLSDIEIKPQRRKLENMAVKAQVLKILHDIGIDDAIAIKVVNLFSDNQEVFESSKERMRINFMANNSDSETEVIDVNDGGVTNGNTEI